MTTEDPTQRLNALGDMTAEVDQDNPTPEQRQEQQDQQREATADEQGANDWAVIPFTVGGMLSMVAPELRQVYSQERCLAWGTYAHATAKKYGWNGPSNLPELGLLAITISMIVPSVPVMAEKLREAKDAKTGTVWARAVLWWKHRKGRKAATTEPEKAEGHGSQQ